MIPIVLHSALSFSLPTVPPCTLHNHWQNRHHPLTHQHPFPSPPRHGFSITGPPHRSEQLLSSHAPGEAHRVHISPGASALPARRQRRPPAARRGGRFIDLLGVSLTPSVGGRRADPFGAGPAGPATCRSGGLSPPARLPQAPLGSLGSLGDAPDTEAALFAAGPGGSVQSDPGDDGRDRRSSGGRGRSQEVASAREVTGGHVGGHRSGDSGRKTSAFINIYLNSGLGWWQ